MRGSLCEHLSHAMIVSILTPIAFVLKSHGPEGAFVSNALGALSYRSSGS